MNKVRHVLLLCYSQSRYSLPPLFLSHSTRFSLSLSIFIYHKPSSSSSSSLPLLPSIIPQITLQTLTPHNYSFFIFLASTFRSQHHQQINSYYCYYYSTFFIHTMDSAQLLTFFCVLLTLAVVYHVSANSEGDALYTLKRSLSDPDNVLQSWDPTLVSPCTWFHVTCNQDNRVTRVDLGNSNLSGRLVPELGKLEHLQYLELYKNNIQGTIPPELGNLKSLVSLDLYNNNITGSIPSSLGKLKNLVFLRLNDNRLTGPIPKELVGISSLKVVDVSNNDLCGTIPTSGPFEHIPLNNFENNPRLEGPELLGLVSYDTNCS